MMTGTHDTLVYRLAQVLVKLNQGEKLDPLALAIHSSGARGQKARRVAVYPHLHT
jgi:hypothetical protein